MSLSINTVKIQFIIAGEEMLSEITLKLWCSTWDHICNELCMWYQRNVLQELKGALKMMQTWEQGAMGQIQSPATSVNKVLSEHSHILCIIVSVHTAEHQLC